VLDVIFHINLLNPTGFYTSLQV